MLHKDTYVKSTPKGLGIFASRRFVRGEILWISEELDIKIPVEIYEKMDERQKSKVNIYCYMDYDRRVVIPWDEGKYVNHSCDPNSSGLLQYDNISVAMKDIAKDEEIVEDYYSYFRHFESFHCSCGAPNCRGTIQRDNTYDPELRLDLNEELGLINSLPQPLLEIKSPEIQDFCQILRNYKKAGAA